MVIVLVSYAVVLLSFLLCGSAPSFFSKLRLQVALRECSLQTVSYHWGFTLLESLQLAHLLLEWLLSRSLASGFLGKRNSTSDSFNFELKADLNSSSKFYTFIEAATWRKWPTKSWIAGYRFRPKDRWDVIYWLKAINHFTHRPFSTLLPRTQVENRISSSTFQCTPLLL